MYSGRNTRVRRNTTSTTSGIRESASMAAASSLKRKPMVPRRSCSIAWAAASGLAPLASWALSWRSTALDAAPTIIRASSVNIAKSRSSTTTRALRTVRRHSPPNNTPICASASIAGAPYRNSPFGSNAGTLFARPSSPQPPPRMTFRWIRPVLLGSAVALAGAAYRHAAVAAPAAGPAPVAQPIPLATPAPKPLDPQLDASLDRLGASEAPELPVPSRLQAPPIAEAKPLPAAQDLLAHAHKDSLGRYLVPGKNGDQALTLDADLQEKLTQLLANYETPYGAVVVLEPATGRVL